MKKYPYSFSLLWVFLNILMKLAPVINKPQMQATDVSPNAILYLVYNGFYIAFFSNLHQDVTSYLRFYINYVNFSTEKYLSEVHTMPHYANRPQSF